MKPVLRRIGWLQVIGLWLFLSVSAWATPMDITDDAGNTLHFYKPPKRVVSLVPSATEIIFAIDAQDALVGITHHSSALRGAAKKTIVGGYTSPSIPHIMALEPDLVIASDFQDEMIGHIRETVPVMVINMNRMDDAFRHMELMGRLLGHGKAASALAEQNRIQLELIARKVATIPPERRKRVMRIMGLKHPMTPGSDSFQNEMIRAAGAIAPDLGMPGAVIPMTKEQWRDFNPQLLYGCGGIDRARDAFFLKEGWNAVDAVTNQNIRDFPCALTCRAGAHLGYFVSWLSSVIYPEEFAKPENEMLPRKVVDTRPVPVDLDYVADAAVATSIIQDFAHKSLIVDFTSPRTIVSTLEGQRSGIQTVGNHYSSPPCWALMGMSGLDPLYRLIYPVIGKEASTTAFLFTGANMDHLAVKKEKFKEMVVYGLVTAGVRGNAVRMGTDVGAYYEPGTINMIFLTNMRLTPRALTRAIISATEGKTAALQDLDIRSSYLSLTAAATGTGTDNIIVVQGDGPVVENAGGHSKLGELIARCAYAGVREAIARQNGIVGPRNIFERLRDRHTSVYQLASESQCECMANKGKLAGRVETLLLDPAYAGFLEAAMDISDGTNRKMVQDLSGFENWCLDVAGRIAGREVDRLDIHVADEKFPRPLAMAFDALFTGVSKRNE